MFQREGGRGEMPPMQMREFLTLNEFARMLERSYGIVRLWATQGRVKAVTKEVKGRTYYRVPVTEAVRVKQELDRGFWI
jgi:predicted site-specific integrase-resolvase